MTESEIRNRLLYLLNRHNDLNRLIDSQNKKQTISYSRLKGFKYARRELKIQVNKLEDRLQELALARNSIIKKPPDRIDTNDFTVRKEGNDFTILRAGPQKQ